MKLLSLIFVALSVAPALAQTPATDPEAVMAQVMAAFTGIAQPPEAVLQAFFPDMPRADFLISTEIGLPEDVTDTAAVLFEAVVWGEQTAGYDGTSLTCLRFGPQTLAYAQQPGVPRIGPMLLLQSLGGWVGNTIDENLIELGVPQAFPEGAVLRQDCTLQIGVPLDMPVQALHDWPGTALAAIKGQFGTVESYEIKVRAPNRRIGLRASDPSGDPSVQVRLIVGMLPYRPFDDTTFPALGLVLRATTYLFTPGS